MQQSEHIFTGGINADDSADLLSEKVYLNAENMRLGNSLYGQFGRMETIESNRQIANAISPVGVNTSIGRVVDYVRNRCFSFFYNSAGNHFIAVMDAAETVLLVVANAQVTGGLGFSLQTPVTAAEIVGDILYWTESSNPRKLNVEAALRAINPTYPTAVIAYTLPIVATVTTVARKPGNYPLSVTKVIDSTVLVNQLQTEGFRFTYYYEYRDGEVSTIAIHSILIPGNFPAQQNNAIDVSLPLAERIEQDVQVVVFVAIFEDSTMVEIRRYNRDNTADATAITNHNNGTAALTYRFTNTSFGTSIDGPFSVKPFDSVWPCKTLEIAKNRLHLANITEGYVTPKVSSLIFSYVPGFGTGLNGAVIKSRSRYAGRVVFFDIYEKPIYGPEGAILDTGNPAGIGGDAAFSQGRWTVSNTNAVQEIPVEAVTYSIVMTKNLVHDLFLVAGTPSILYADYDASTDKYTFTATTYTPGRAGIGLKATFLIGYGLGYTFQPGDIARFTNGNSAVYTAAVKATQGDWIIVEPQDIGTVVTTGFTVIGMFEIYTPAAVANNNNYYEVGLRFAITQPGTPARTYSITTGRLPGDVFFTERNYNSTTVNVEAMNPNDKVWRQWNTSHGRLYAAVALGQQVLKTGQRWSNKYIAGTAVNGLSSFDAADVVILPAEMGSVQRLILTSKVQEDGSVMLAVGELQIESEYLGETQVVESTSTAFIASSAATVGTINTLRLAVGTRHPATICEKDGNVFGFDVQQGVVWQYSRAGLQDVSDRRMKQQWLAWSKAYTAQYGVAANIVAGINEFSGEYQLSLPPVTGIGGAPWVMLDGTAKVVSYNYVQGTWSGSSLYQPQQLFYMNRRWYSITGSFFRCHDVQGQQVVLDGIVRTARLMFIATGGNFRATKVWQTISIAGRQAPDNVFAQAYLPYDQQTTLVKAVDPAQSDWETFEGKHYASFLMNTIHDVLPPNEALLFGENMRSQTLYLMMEWVALVGAPTAQNKIYINSVHLGCQLSSGHTI